MKEKVVHLAKKVKKNIVEYVITNRLFLSYVVLSIISTMLVRKFTIGTFFALKPFLTDLGLILILGALGYLVKPQNQFKYFFTWTLIFTILCIVSSIYYTFYTSFASFGDLATVAQVETVTGSIYEKLRFVDLMYILFPITFYLIHHALSSSTYYYFVSKFEKGKKMAVGTILVGVLCLGYSFGTATGTDYSRLSKQWYRAYIVERFGVILYQCNDLVQSLTPKLGSLFGYEEALEKFTTYFNEKEEKQNNEYTGILKDNTVNIIFVHLESIQTFLMDIEINGSEVTPNLNQLASSGMFFNNFYPQVSTGTSSDTEFTLLTGLMPAASGTVFVSYYNREYFTIPKYLETIGYYTFSMHGNFSAMWNRNRAHPSLGYEGLYFEEYYEYTDMDVVNLGINDFKFFEQVVPIVENIEQTYNNYMGTIITLSNHSPFSVAAEHSTLDFSTTTSTIDEETGEEIITTHDYLSNTAIGEYIRSANYADAALGAFLEYVKNSPEFDNTLFVFYGDHDAKLSRSEINEYLNLNWETGELYAEENENYQQYTSIDHELNKKTPLILWSKNPTLANTFKGTISYPMGMYDVAPTILNMYGMYNKYTVGNDIFNVKEDNIVVFPNGNFLNEYVYYNNSTGKHWDLKQNTSLSDEQISELALIAEEKLEISNYIIVHNLLDSVDMTGE